MLAAGRREAKDWEGGWEKDGFGNVKSLTMTQPTCRFVVRQYGFAFTVFKLLASVFVSS